MRILLYALVAIPLFLWGLLSAFLGMFVGQTIMQNIYGILGGILMALALIALAVAEIADAAAKKREVLEELVDDNLDSRRST